MLLKRHTFFSLSNLGVLNNTLQGNPLPFLTVTQNAAKICIKNCLKIFIANYKQALTDTTK